MQTGQAHACVICLEDIADPQESESCVVIANLYCGHVFHYKCVREWTLSQRRRGLVACCPICNRPIIIPPLTGWRAPPPRGRVYPSPSYLAQWRDRTDQDEYTVAQFQFQLATTCCISATVVVVVALIVISHILGAQ